MTTALARRNRHQFLTALRNRAGIDEIGYDPRLGLGLRGTSPRSAKRWGRAVIKRCQLIVSYGLKKSAFTHVLFGSAWYGAFATHYPPNVGGCHPNEHLATLLFRSGKVCRIATYRPTVDLVMHFLFSGRNHLG